MESLAKALIAQDIEEKKRRCHKEIFNLLKYRSQIKAFNRFLNKNFTIPISSQKFKGKLAYIDLVLRRNEVFLCFNITYNKRGKPTGAEVSSGRNECLFLNDVSSIRTLSGAKLKHIDVRKLKQVKVVDIDKLFATTKTVRVTENAMENFACRDSTYNKWNDLLPSNNVL